MSLWPAHLYHECNGLLNRAGVINVMMFSHSIITPFEIGIWLHFWGCRNEHRWFSCLL